MNISIVKSNIESYKGKIIHFKYFGARNQTEEFDGRIENTYNAIFTIKPEKSNKIKSFTYSDVITENLKIFI
ncbi:MAG: Veg family protein [Bacilli bacterium]|nr:Veg family protein [Bacilli bacterium]